MALLIMIVKDLQTMHELLTVLEQPILGMQELCSWAFKREHYPGCRIWERDLAALPDQLPRKLACWAPLGDAHAALGPLEPRRGRGQPGVAR